MNFVLVNDRAARASSACAHCSSSIGAGYLRDLSTARLYCDYECYAGHRLDIRQQAAVDLRHLTLAGVAATRNS